MAQTLIIIDNQKDWAHYYPSDQVVSFSNYLEGAFQAGAQRTRVINLCRSFSYLSTGYYCSLLAEARGHNVIPSVRTINDLSKRSLYRMQLDELSDSLCKFLSSKSTSAEIKVYSFFGSASDSHYTELARKLFERFPCPILEISLRYRRQWEISALKPLSPHELEDEPETQFANALDEFSRKVWRKQRDKKMSRFDLAILHDPEEKFPPSCKTALKRFVTAGKELGIDCEMITQRDYLRLPEFDGLFIRATTNIDHYTYRFAKKAETEGLVVIDDPNSILRCTNKIYLADLFRTHKVPTPKTVLLQKNKPQQLETLEETLGFPIVIKIPDGSFSRGVEKANNRQQLKDICQSLFKKTTLLLAQEFMYTDFDWRIGVLDKKPLYACRYFMVKDHWQIYRHGGDKSASGKFETLPTFEVPSAILDTALKATRPIGNGFYGVDIKESKGKGYVIEVNDNPNIDMGVEDKYLGMELYRLILGTMLKRMESRRNS